jgi:hypothetical protein
MGRAILLSAKSGESMRRANFEAGDVSGVACHVADGLPVTDAPGRIYAQRISAFLRLRVVGT